MSGDRFWEDATPEVTRRKWLLRLGEMVALAGISGLLPESATAFVSADQQAGTELPPGLYESSNKHLMHALASDEASPPVLPGSATEYVQHGAEVFEPHFFSREEFRVIMRLIEVLLGKVDPGSLDQTAQWIDLWLHSAARIRAAARQLDPLHRTLAVAYYGETIVRELETFDPATVMRAGLAALQHSSGEQFGSGFSDLTESQQMQLVSTISTAPEASPLRKFFDMTRREAIRGFYTSRAGLKELDYQGNAYYTDCPGCDSNMATKPTT